MVYDPVRDCDIPSPAIGRQHPVLWETPPPNAGSAGSAGTHQQQPPHQSGPLPPPPFQPERSPIPSPSLRPPSSAGLRSLLNDEAEYFVSRRGSDHTVSSVTDDEAPHPSARPHLAKLLNEPAPPRRPTSSHSAHSHESPRLSSPSVSLHPSASGPSRPQPGVGGPQRSPLLSPNIIPATHLVSSPASTTSAYPPYDQHVPGPSPSGPSSRRSSVAAASTMPPPSEPHVIHRHDSAPAVQATHLRSPAASVSPRAHSMGLPGPGPSPAVRRGSTSASRPTSGRNSSSGAFAAPLPPTALSSPESSQRRSSDDASNVGAGTNGNHPRSKYHPDQPSSYRSISAEALTRLRDLAYANNPLRRKVPRTAPSWSAPSPRVDEHEPRSGAPSRRGSTASAAANDRPYPGARTSDQDSSLVGTKRDSADLNEPNGRWDRGAPRRRTENYTGNAGAVASHYNSRPEVGVEHREYSPIIGLKKFNNWVKSVLIGKFTARPEGRKGAKVLDLGCGKGGDLNKWKQARISLYVGMDIAATSIEQARNRWNTMRGNPFDAFFAAHDCFARPINEVLPRELQERDLYDNVSLQFCMHYAFETPAKARMMMENVSRYLKLGGVFLGTIPNSALLLERLDQVPEDADELTFGNSCYSISFTERRHNGLYGHEYRFFLEDAVEDVPEYIVDWDNFVSLAREYGLDLIYRKTFNDILQEEQGSRDFGPLLGKMGVINEYGESAMDEDQWEAANLYMAFAFEKRR